MPIERTRLIGIETEAKVPIATLHGVDAIEQAEQVAYPMPRRKVRG